LCPWCALRAGSSVGGARPKALLIDGDRQLIAKFSSLTDTWPIVRAEYVGMSIAACCGLDVAHVDFFEARATRRAAPRVPARAVRPGGVNPGALRRRLRRFSAFSARRLTGTPTPRWTGAQTAGVLLDSPPSAVAP
jgi:hypothetical protein